MKPFLFALLASLTLLYSGCRCEDPADPACKNYDPCYVQGAVSAAFEMHEYVGWWPEKLPVYHQVNSCNSVILRAKQELNSYEWQVGTEPTPRTGRQITVSFGCFPYGNVPIRLIARGTPNVACDPNDDGIDTLVQYVQVLKDSSLPIVGTYKGRHVHVQEQEDFVVEIRIRPHRPYMDSVPPPPTKGKGYYLMNLPNRTPKPQWGVSSDWIYSQIAPLDLLPGGEGFWMPANENGWYSYAPEGYGRLSADGDSLTIRYTILDSVRFWAAPPLYVRNEKDTLTFIGIRQ